jgi:ribosomal protein S18 acetylase RimI-like enzyme
MLSTAFDAVLLSRIEDAGLNASAPPQQRWLDGWLVRFSAGKAKRARCINAVALGRMPVADKLALCAALFAEAGLPLHVRITPFSQPSGLDGQLAKLGMTRIDDTRVMVCPSLTGVPSGPTSAIGHIDRVGHEAFAQIVGHLRGSPLAQRQAHAQRLGLSPVPFQAFVMKNETGAVVACGQIAREAELVGLYDVFTEPASRSLGLARQLCEHMLSMARAQGARVAYLQVEGDNHAARRVYQRLGFNDAYAYHYRQRPDSSA